MSTSTTPVIVRPSGDFPLWFIKFRLLTQSLFQSSQTWPMSSIGALVVGLTAAYLVAGQSNLENIVGLLKVRLKKSWRGCAH